MGDEPKSDEMLLHYVIGDMIMTQDNVKAFEKARDQLLAQPVFGRSPGQWLQRGQTKNHIERIVRVQTAIDVVTAAINQEHLASPQPAASGPQPKTDGASPRAAAAAPRL